ncbi:LOW QUALITY PROTEIN: beta-1,3-galactosyltransferase 6 [Dermatophagoides farinae]|uniref:LOW QUALITY PROTEIN: beta-1,3-galactosyltransferase 6 n=1 Tax=Dermatophagoides farinae TaxID=6954 RepID=UPI003F63F41C
MLIFFFVKMKIIGSRRIYLIVAFFAGFILCFILMNIIFGSSSKLNDNHSDQIFYPFVDNSDHHFLICIVFTSVKNLARRNCIRDTWINLGNNLQFKHYFVIGTNKLSSETKTALLKEQHQHHDLMLLSNLSDTYQNLSLKLIQSFHWISDHHRGKFEYLIKVDDDSFARIDAIYRWLEQRNLKNSNKLPIYWGFFDGRAHVKQKGVWKEKNWFLCDRYLPYALGGGYVLSHELIEFIASNSHWLQLYQSEDVSLGTWLSPLHIERLHDINFDTEYRSRGCINTFLVQHKQTVVDMTNKYNSLINFGYLCYRNQQLEQRLVYEYNWHELPTKCCIRNKTML